MAAQAYNSGILFGLLTFTAAQLVQELRLSSGHPAANRAPLSGAASEVATPAARGVLCEAELLLEVDVPLVVQHPGVAYLRALSAVRGHKRA